MIRRFTDNFIQYLDVWLGSSNLLAEEAAEGMEYELQYEMNYTPLIPSDTLYKRFNILTYNNCIKYFYNNYDSLKNVGNHICDIQTFWNTGYYPTTEYSSFSIKMDIVQNFKKIYTPSEGQSLITKCSQNKFADNVVFNVCELYDNPIFIHYYDSYKSNHKKSLYNIENYIINQNKRQYEIIIKQPQRVSFKDVCLMGYSDTFLNSSTFQSEFSLAKHHPDREEGWFNYPFKDIKVKTYYNKLWKIDNYNLDMTYYFKD